MELDTDKVHEIVEKGQDKRVEMYSAFADPFRNPCVSKSSLSTTLRNNGITDVFIAGLAADYCVKYTAIDSAEGGYRTRVIGEATRAVDPSVMDQVMEEYAKVGVTVITADDASRFFENATQAADPSVDNELGK
jgi:nicotinamidase-related amidase